MKGNNLLYGCFMALTLSASNVASANIGEQGTVEYTRKTEILGMVYHSENRKPLRDVVITAYNATNKKESRAITDQLGNYTFTDLKPGLYRVVYERDGFRKVSREKVLVKIEEGLQLDIAMDEINDFDWIPGTFKFSGGE